MQSMKARSRRKGGAAPALWLLLGLLVVSMALGPVWAEGPRPDRSSPAPLAVRSSPGLQAYPPPATDTPTPEQPTVAPTPTHTPVSPTATLVATATPTSEAYPPPATATPTATPTNTPTPTSTPTVPQPTATPTTGVYPWPTLTPRAYLPLIYKVAGVVAPTATPTLVARCVDIVRNGGFEQYSDWELPATAYSAGYSSARFRTGSRSLRTGIVYSYDNRYSYSSGQQKVTLPTGLTSATLRFWMYPMSGDAGPVPTPYPRTAATLQSLENLSYDVQYVLILDEWDRWIDTLIWHCRDDRQWLFYSFDLMRYTGRTIKLHFGSYNTGYGGVTAMYIDDVSLEVCYPGVVTPTVTHTPTRTPTRTPTATPRPCTEAISNGGFEQYGVGWWIPATKYSAGYSSAVRRSGSWAMRLGIVYPSHNTYSYSDAQQTVYIPADIASAKLRFWTYPMSGDPRAVPWPDVRTLGDLQLMNLAYDVQYLLILDRDNKWIDTLLWHCRDDRQWLYYEHDLARFAGQTIKLQFGVYNTGYGGVTAMYLDDVSLEICYR
ncbi:MAG: hypothetical protein FJZ90_12210 [Chloroflexi bacterium]|nr:hypothetical protein [Chloroflexota bacterium]